MVVIVWQLDLQLHMQPVPITAKVVSSNPAHGEMYSMQHYVIMFVRELGRSVVFSGYSGEAGLQFSLGTPERQVCSFLRVLRRGRSVVFSGYSGEAGLQFSLGTPVSSNNKYDCQDITEILLKVALNTIKQTKPSTS